MLNDPENDDRIELVPTVDEDSACLIPSTVTMAINGANIQPFNCYGYI